MKPIRIVDEELLEVVRGLPCLACASLNPQGALEDIGEDYRRSHPHHVTSRGAGGGDVPENLMPLCQWHHREIHQSGTATFALKYPVVKDWIIAASGVTEL